MDRLGTFALLLGLGLSIYGLVASVVGAKRGRPLLIESARTTAYSLLAVLAAANGAMLAAILANDFSIKYVAENSSRETPTFFKVLSLWSADEGSLLLWNLILAGFIAAVAFRFRKRKLETFPWAMAVMYGVSIFYLVLVIGPTRPFAALQSAPLDGRGPLPLLQNHPLMAVHPPFLYLGFIGFTVPFAFAKSAVGPMYLGFLVLVLAGGFGLIAIRSWRLRSEGRFDAVLSRESAFLGNNLVLLAVTFVVLLGTIFPLFVEALADRQSTVGGPYFQQTAVPLFLLLLFLMGIGPLLSWRRTSPGQLRRRVTGPALAGAATVVGIALLGVRSPGAVLAYGLAVFVLVGNVGELIRGVRAYARATGRRGAATIPSAMSRNRRLYGGLVVHVGMALVAIAVTTSSSFASRTEVTLSRGEQTAFAGYVLRYEGERQIAQPQRIVLVADVSVSKDGEDLGRVTPSLNLYPAASEPIGTPSIRFGVFRDFYASLIGFDGDGESATFRFFLNPGVTWLWLGGLIVALGGLLAAWPGSRRTRAPPSPLIRSRELAVVSERD